MTIKEILLQEIESSPESLLEETLDFLRFLKTKQTVKKDTQSPHIKPETGSSDTLPQAEEKPTDSSQLPYRPASGRSILRHAGTWAGDDFDECLVGSSCDTLCLRRSELTPSGGPDPETGCFGRDESHLESMA